MEKLLLFLTFVAAFVAASAAAADSALANDNPAVRTAVLLARRHLQDKTATILRAHRHLSESSKTVNATCQSKYSEFYSSAIFGGCAEANETTCPSACQNDIDAVLNKCACGDVTGVDSGTGKKTVFEEHDTLSLQMWSSKKCSFAKNQCLKETCQGKYTAFAVSAYFGHCADADKEAKFCPDLCQKDIDAVLNKCKCGDVYYVNLDTGEKAYWKPTSAITLALMTPNTCSIEKNQCTHHPDTDSDDSDENSHSSWGDTLDAFVTGVFVVMIVVCVLCCAGIAGGIVGCCFCCECCPVHQARQKIKVDAQPCPAVQNNNNVNVVAMPVTSVPEAQVVMVVPQPISDPVTAKAPPDDNAPVVVTSTAM